MQQFNYPPQANSFGLSVGRVKKPNKSIGKLTKADISAPSNFKHVAHYGWGDLKCFDLNSEDAKNVTEILEKAHVSEEQFNDRRTRAIIYDFLEKNVLDSTKAEKQTQSPIQTQSPVSPKNVGFCRIYLQIEWILTISFSLFLFYSIHQRHLPEPADCQ